MIIAKSMRTQEIIPVERFQEYRTSAPSLDLVCPDCNWTVRYYKAGGNNAAHFRHAPMPGNKAFKNCPKYKAGENPGVGGGEIQPMLSADDQQALTEILQSYVIHLLAQDGGFVGADRSSYAVALRESAHHLIMAEADLGACPGNRISG